MNNNIIKREVFSEIIKYLNTNNIIVLHGSRQVGKSHILYFLQDFLKTKNELTYFFDLEDSRFVDVFNSGIDSFLTFLKNEGFELEKIKNSAKRLYIFIDEIQYLDNPSSILKLLVDHHQYIQLIVSGSSSFNIKSKFSDSLVGRTVNFEIFNLSFQEFLKFRNIEYDLTESLSEFHLNKVIELYSEYVYYGGYPKIVLEDSIEKKEKYLQQIIDTYIKKDIRDIANVKDITKFNNLLKVLASCSGQLLNVARLANTCAIAQQTVENYLFILENTYVIKLVHPYSSSAKVEIIKAPKVFFYDTGLLQMLLLKHLPKSIIGNVFETSVFSELVKKYGIENINYWRHKNKNEIDFILNYKGNILPIEVKMNFENFKKHSISFFCDKYKINDYKVISLKGKKQNPNYIYPWELSL